MNWRGSSPVGRYSDQDRRTRAHVAIRWRTCPFGGLLDALPRHGSLLDVGCGHGLLSLAFTGSGPGRTASGVDLDAEKIDCARRAAHGPRTLPTTFEIGSIESVEGTFDAIAVVDVLYLLTAAEQRALLAAAVDRLAPGGVLLVKEMAHEPAWKLWIAKAQEQFAVKVVNMTMGGTPGLTFTPPRQLESVMSDLGLAVRCRPLDKGYPWPHHLLIASRSADVFGG